MRDCLTTAQECRTCKRVLPAEFFGSYLGRSGTKRVRYTRKDCNPCRREARRAVYMDRVLLELGAADESTPKWK